MAKYVCPACKKILIRSYDDIRVSGSTSYCEEADKSVKLTRLRLGKPQSKRSGKTAIKPVQREHISIGGADGAGDSG